MFSGIQVLFCLVALAAAQSFDTFTLGRGIGGWGYGNDLSLKRLVGDDYVNRGIGYDVIDRQLTGDYVTVEVEDKKILKDLVRLDVVNKHLVKKLLVLDVVDRKIVGDLARAINHIIVKKGNMYPLTLWDRVLKIKGVATPFAGYGAINRQIENNWIETEIEDKQILHDLIKIATIDRTIVTDLLFLDEIDRKIVADVVTRINFVVLKKGPVYPMTLLERVMKIRGFTGVGAFGYNTPLTNIFGLNRGYGTTYPTFGLTGMY